MCVEILISSFLPYHFLERAIRERSDHLMMNIEGHGGLKEEIRAAEGSSGSQDDCKDSHHEFDVAAVDDTNMGRSPHHSLISRKKQDQDNQLECAKAKVGEVREENDRLKLHLDRITKEYKTLQMKFHDIVQQDSHKHNNDNNNIIYDEETEEENQLVSLSLGRVGSDSRKDEKSTKASEPSSSKQSLSLGLESKLLQVQTASKSVVTETLSNRSTSNSFEELKDEAGETWPPSKVVMKAKRSGDDEVSRQTPIAKKARVSVRARCDTPTMNDGCQWRKYGQKISKGNPCPRAYYRCTVAPNCPVRKQVQRCSQDMSILITTYEGNHNHPLSLSATAMASTTSAAASMLLSGSSTTTTCSPQLHGLSDLYNPKSKPFFLPNSSSSSPSFPTITLDLTSSNNPNNLSRPSYPPTSLSFSSSDASSNMGWGGASVLNYGTQQRYPTNFGLRNGQLPDHSNGSENVYQQMKNHMNMNTGSSSNHIMNQQYTLAAATKAITTDPTFQSALAAALTSVIGNQGGEQSQKMKWGELFPTINSGSRYLMNNSSSVINSQQPGGFMFLPPSLPFSTPKSTSTSPSETRDQAM